MNSCLHLPISFIACVWLSYLSVHECAWFCEHPRHLTDTPHSWCSALGIQTKYYFWIQCLYPIIVPHWGRDPCHQPHCNIPLLILLHGVPLCRALWFMAVWPDILKKGSSELIWNMKSYEQIEGPLVKRSFIQQRPEYCWQRANENKLIQWGLCEWVSECVCVCARLSVCTLVRVSNSWHSPKRLLKTWWHRTGNWDIWILWRPLGLASHTLPHPCTPPTCSSRLQPLVGIV